MEVADTKKYSFIAEYCLQCFVEGGQLVEFVDGPHPLLSMDSVMFYGTRRCIFESKIFPFLLLFAPVLGKTLCHTPRKA